MEKAWLEQQLVAGRSIEDIAREVRRDPSTVAYWVNKHGLRSQHADRHAPMGGTSAPELRALVECGLSTREIAAEHGVSQTTVRYWLREHEMKTQPARYVVAADDKPDAVLRECSKHGWTSFTRGGKTGYYRCKVCRSERVSTRRRRAKEILVAEAGGCCTLCGFDGYAGALQFHHVDPTTKKFEIGGRGLTRSIDRLRQEARKCVLLCANCHAKVEAGISRLPFVAAPGAPG